MRVLVDTQALLWVLLAPARISDRAREVLLDPANDVLVSVASAWEIAIKRGLGKLVLPETLEDGVHRCGFRFLPVTAEHCEALGDLPASGDHRDPFDRMLAVQARLDGCRLLSKDAKLDRYGVQRIW